MSLESPSLRAALDAAVENFVTRNPKSKALHEKAVKTFPGGNTRTVLHTDPFPLCMKSGKGYQVFSEDGDTYTDLTAEFTAGLYGHSNPDIIAVLQHVIQNVGLNVGATTAQEQLFARELCDRFDIERVRLTNSGTEANLHALAAAKLYTGKSKVVAFDGGYHGAVLGFKDGKVAANNVDKADWIVAKYNDVEGTIKAIKSEGVAAVILEAMQGSGGCICGTKEFLTGAGVVFIVDEVMTSRISGAGLSAVHGLKPDMKTFGKYLGGGVAFGAFGGRQDIMAVYDPRVKGSVAHSGTFNNNTFVTHCGYAGLTKVYTSEVAEAFTKSGDDLLSRLNEVSKGTKLCFTGTGSVATSHFVAHGPRSIANALDVTEIEELKDLFWFYLLENGFWVTRRGFYALAHRVPALSVVVEDEQEHAIVLRLENQPDEKSIPSRQYLSKGTVLLLKEPFLQADTSGGQCTLRVDHVSDLIWLHGEDERIPIAWRPRISETDSVKSRLRGNDFFKKSELGNALQHYTQAIKSAQTPVDAQVAHVNRALVNLRLGRLEDAFNDAVAMKFELQPTEKGMFREATCLYKLQKFDQCLLKFQELQSRYPSNKYVLSEIKRVNTRLKECNDGIFDWLDMHKQAEYSPPLIDCATFSKSTEIRESPGLGRGLFTTKPIAAGELLLCEKAFSFNFTGEDEERNSTLLVDPDTMNGMPDCYLQDVAQVVQKLYHEPGMAPLFLELDHGDYTAPQPGLQVDGKPVVDSFLVARIIYINAFTAPRSTLKHLRTVLDGKLDNDKPWLTSSGIWWPVDLDRAWELLRQIDETYNKSGQIECKFTLQQGYYSLASRLMKKGDLVEATAVLLRVLGLGGFTWAPRPAENGYQNSAMIEIRKWGPERVVSFSAIQSLYRICRKAGAERRAPKQFAIMRAYAEIAHSLIVGEPETFC
ncbi:hypothetical protein NHJ13734_001440 [Beauveria thailandica]